MCKKAQLIGFRSFIVDQKATAALSFGGTRQLTVNQLTCNLLYVGRQRKVDHFQVHRLIFKFAACSKLAPFKDKYHLIQECSNQTTVAIHVI